MKLDNGRKHGVVTPSGLGDTPKDAPLPAAIEIGFRSAVRFQNDRLVGRYAITLEQFRAATNTEHAEESAA